MIIGIADSGIGGLNVLASLIKNRCGDKFLYLADGANLPYGDKSAEGLKNIALRNARTLIERGANLIVFGCNTLSVTALDHVRRQIAPPLFGLRPRVELLPPNALLMTTPTTALYLPKIEPSVSLLTPAKLATLIDRDYPDERRIREYLSPLLVPYKGVKTVCLGCSHYAFAKGVIRETLPEAKITDGSESLAALIRAVLPKEGRKDPSVEFLFTGEEEHRRYAALLTDLLA